MSHAHHRGSMLHVIRGTVRPSLAGTGHPMGPRTLWRISLGQACL